MRVFDLCLVSGGVSHTAYLFDLCLVTSLRKKRAAPRVVATYFTLHVPGSYFRLGDIFFSACKLIEAYVSLPLHGYLSLFKLV